MDPAAGTMYRSKLKSCEQIEIKFELNSNLFLIKQTLFANLAKLYILFVGCGCDSAPIESRS